MSDYSVVAIDGPAASGKSSVARLLAEKLAFAYVNSGAMYRAMAWLAYEHRIDPHDKPLLLKQMAETKIEFRLRSKELTIALNGVNPDAHLKEGVVNRTVSIIAAVPEVRHFLVDRLRTFVSFDNVVMEGRDIGTVVFPDTPYKFYIDASPDIRAKRRAAQGYQDDLASRDRLDSSRRSSPLTIAPDAQVIDSSSLTISGVVGAIIERLQKQGLLAAGQL